MYFSSLFFCGLLFVARDIGVFFCLVGFFLVSVFIVWCVCVCVSHCEISTSDYSLRCLTSIVRCCCGRHCV